MRTVAHMDGMGRQWLSEIEFKEEIALRNRLFTNAPSR